MILTFTPLLIYKVMFDRISFPIFQLEALAEFMNMDWKLFQGNQHLPSKTIGKRKIRISQDMERDG